MALTQASEEGLKISNAGTNGQYLQKQSGNTGGLTWADVPAGVGGATGVDFNDSVKARFGTDNDIELYHDNSNAYLKNSTGNFMITGNNSDKIHIRAHASKQEIVCTPSGAVKLYYDDALKFETISGGCTVTGGAGSASLKLNTSDGTLRGYIYGDDNNHVYLLDGQGHSHVKGIKDGAVELYHDNAKKLETCSTGTILHKEAFITGVEDGDARLYFHADEGDDNADKWQFGAATQGHFYIQNLASGSWETNIECNGNGNVELYHDNSKRLETTANGITIVGDRSNTAGTGHIRIAPGDTTSIWTIRHDSTGNDLWFDRGTDASSTAYIGFSSDGNIKFTAGKGIDFSAQTASSATGASTSSEVLDHYEEGTWTPVYEATSTDPTYSNWHTTGTYIRIGGMCYVWYDPHEITFSGTASAGYGYISGFPFASTDNGSLACGRTENVLKWVSTGNLRDAGLTMSSSNATAEFNTAAPSRGFTWDVGNASGKAYFDIGGGYKCV